ncbi:MAG TPA: hypothetical protein VLB47_09595, partial [Solirubrobacteraceae bacterium]|nr:hypothetical protein [Solirubrobacteraceae bacterium]
MRRALPVAELGLALVAAIAATAGAHALVAALGLDATDRLAAGIGPVWAAAMVAVAVAAHVVERRVRRPARARMAVALLAGLAAGLAGAPLMAGLLHTAQPPYGVLAGDMAFRAEYVTRFAATWH